MDGFDKYGLINSGAVPYLTQEWTTVTGSPTIVAGLSATGSAIALVNGQVANRSLGVNAPRLIGGVRFSSGLTTNHGLTFFDVSTAQATISIGNAGAISIRNGTIAGTIINTSVATVTANSIHYLEWDITFTNTGAYQIWLDGVSILSGTGDMTGTANNYANTIGLVTPAGSSGVLTFDDLYVFDTTGTTNNAVLLTSPRIETQFPNADAAVQFGIGASTIVVGGTTSRAGATATTGLSAALWLRFVVPSRNCTLNSISFVPAFNNAAANFRVCLYADTGAGIPGALITSGSLITGATNGVTVTGTITPQSLTAGTQYWIGFITDAGGSTYISYEINGQARQVGITFASGPPATAPAMSVSSFTPMFWGNVTNINANYYEVGQNPVSGNLSYLFDATVGHEDLYQFPPLSTPPVAIYAVAVKANLSKSDAGAKTASVRLKSGATDSAGTGGVQAPGASYAWFRTHFETDPNTGSAWTLAALNASQAGVKVES